MVKRASIYVFKKLWQIAALLLVTLAVVTSLLRLALPYADGYRQDIELWVADNYDVNISIGSLSAGWERFGPAIIVQDVTFEVPEHLNTTLEIAETRLELDFWGSLLERSFRARNVILVGVDLSLSDDLLLENEEPPASQDDPLAEVLSSVFLQQLHRFALVDSQVTIQTHFEVDPVIHIKKLNWLNKNEHHQGTGQLWLGDASDQQVSVILDLYGEERESVFGQLYVHTDHLQFGRWLNKYLPEGLSASYASASLQAWTFIEKGVVKQSQLQIDDVKTNLSKDGVNHVVSMPSGQVKWRSLQDGWRIKTSDVQIVHNNNDWLPVNAMITVKDEIDVFVGDIAIDPVSELALLVPQLAEFHGTIQQLSPMGTMGDVIVNVDANDIVSASATLTDLHIEESANNPSFSINDATIYWQDQRGYLKLLSQNNAISYAGMFDKPFWLSELDADVYISNVNDEWLIETEGLALKLEQANFVTDMSLVLGEQPRMSLAAELTDIDVVDIDSLFPVDLMGDDLVNYLSHSLVSGQVPKAKIVFEGAFAAFPFDNNDGVFQAYVDMENLNFNFDDEWPNLTETFMQLQFVNSGMVIDVDSANIAGVPATDLEAKIPDFGDNPTLTLVARIDEDVKKVDHVMINSPLRNSVGSTLEYMDLQGHAKGSIRLEIPLGEEGETRALGVIHLDGNTARLPTPEMVLTELDGTLSFENDHIEVKGLKLLIDGMPSTLDVTASQNDESDLYELNIKVDGVWKDEELFSVYVPFLNAYIDGDVGFSGDIYVGLPETDDFVVTIDSTFDLTQSAINLPLPYVKEMGEAQNLLLNVLVDQDKVEVNADLDERLGLHAVMPSESDTFTQVILELSEAELTHPALPDYGFDIIVNLNTGHFDEWFDLISAMIEGEETTDTAPETPPLFPTPKAIQAKFNQFDIFDAEIERPDFHVKRDADSWQTIVTADNLNGNFTIYDDWLGKGIIASIHQANLFSTPVEELPPSTNQQVDTTNTEVEQQDDLVDALEEVEEAIETLSDDEFFASFPPVEMACDDCTFFDIPMGKVNTKVVRTETGILFEDISIVDPNSTVKGVGSWLVTDGVGRNSFQLNIKSKDIGVFLDKMKVPTSVRESESETDIDLSWDGMLFDFDLATLDGTLKSKMGYGYIAEVSDSGARIFSILSLESIVRKLRLDFRDVFSEGFFFNSINSTMVIKKGVARTSNTKVNGIPGDLSVRGQTNLVTRELQYRLEFAPKVTSSVPIILGWLVNPVVGIGAFALDKTLHSAKVISLLRFDLTGTMDDPVVTEVSRESKDITVPDEFIEPEVIEVAEDELTPTEGLQKQDESPESEQNNGAN